jgi:hypothetical protein
MKAIGRTTHGRFVGATLMSVLVLLLGGAIFHPAAASMVGSPSDQDIVVQLGVHKFGDLREADATVAIAGQDDVGFYESPNGEGDSYGPASFEVAPDGAIWLLDSINYRLLVWQPGRSNESARVPLPLGIADFALGLDGTIYATYPDPESETKTLGLAALSPTGELLWTAPTIIEIFNAELLAGPDGAIYAFGADESRAWTPLTTPDGRVLAIDKQRKGTTPYQPLAGGQRLTREYVSPTEQRFTLSDKAGRPVHTWLVASDTEIASNFTVAGLVDGDLVVALDVLELTEKAYLWEYLVLRLSPTGEIQQQFSLDRRAVWGDDLFAGVRLGPDGHLYQLSTDPTTGASVGRYLIDPAPAPAPSPSPPPANVEPAAVPPTVTESPAPRATLHQAREVAPASRRLAFPVGAPAASNHARGWSLAGLSLLGAGLLGLGLWYWYVRRRGHWDGEPHSTYVCMS